MSDTEEWPRHVHIVIWLAVFTMLSSFAGNVLGWQQWRHPLPIATPQSPFTHEPVNRLSPDEEGRMSILPFVLMASSSLASVGLLIFLAFRMRPQKSASAPVNGKSDNPLRIISAHWGIGGDAYRDVTDIVRGHTKPDSVNIPASIGILGDPYPGAGKHLEVRYSFARERAITVPESEYLKLPEKEGEERGRKELQAMKARVDSMISAEDVLISGLSATEYSLFITTKAEFISLPWCQKVALKRICKLGTVSSADFQRGLASDGFADPAKIVGQLVIKDFLSETVNGILKPHISRAKFIDVLLEGMTLC